MYWQNHIYMILPRENDNPFDILVQDTDSKEIRLVSYEDVFLNQEDETTPIFAQSYSELQTVLDQHQPPPIPVPGTTLPLYTYEFSDAVIRVVEMIDAVVAELEAKAIARGKLFKRTDAVTVACIAADPPIGVSTYYKYRKLYQAYNADRVQIAASFRRSTADKWKVTKQQLHFIDSLIARYYTREERPRPSTMYKFAQEHLSHTQGQWIDPDKCGKSVPLDLTQELLNQKIPVEAILVNPQKSSLLSPINLPSRSWLFPYLQWFRLQPQYGKAIIQKHLGKQVWDEEHLAFERFVHKAQFSLQYVFADHWLIDVFTVDERTRSKIKRLWLTLLIDAYSRYIPGFTLQYEAPCIESIMSALRHSIFPKTSHKGLGFDVPWDACGIPLRLFLDNAWAHHSHTLEQLARVIGQNNRYNAMELDWRPPYKGHYGNIIEALFGHFGALMQEFIPGAIRSSDSDEFKNAVKGARLLHSDMNGIVHQIILRYIHSPHSALFGMTPHEKFLEGLQAGPPLIPALTPAVDRLFWRKGDGSRQITQHGIGAFGLHYNSNTIRYAREADKSGKPIKFDWSYEPSNISRIAIFRGTTFISDVYASELKLADDSHLDLSLAELEIAKELSRKKGYALADLVEFRDEIRELAHVRGKEQRAAQQKKPQSASRRAPLPTASDVQLAQEAIIAAQADDDDLAAALRGFATKG